MDTAKKFCTILTPEDLLAENLKFTVKTIQHNPNKFYLLQAGWDIELCYVIENLSKSSDDDTLLTKARFAYDLNFNLRTTLRIGDSNSGVEASVKTFAELLELLDFSENLTLRREDYHVIVDDTLSEESSDSAVSKLFQQLVFLNLNLDVKKKSEIKKSLIKTRFRSKYSKLIQEISASKDYLQSAVAQENLSVETVQRVEKIIAAFDIMLTEFGRAKERPIRIAAMGTKKAGKSVVINSFLKRDYAPTSLILPTPNTIKYIPAPVDEPITLDYAGRTFTFDSAESIRNFIGREFERAKKDSGKGAGLPDMTIHYPSDDLNGYEIWDTPGPNVAFTDEHRKNAEACIREVDVCIFVMNYSSHLTTDEIGFLKNIHEAFQSNNKFYSLFMTVNRIDERYNDKEEKSVARILDYISGRLENLTPPYKNIVVFGTSALQSFYLDEVVELMKADGENLSAPLDEDLIRRLKRRHKDSMVPIRFIENALTNLEDFHSVDSATVRELYAYSGVPQLWSYVKYVGSQKADMEIVDSVISKCESQFAAASNALLVADLLNLSAEDKFHLEELKRLIEDLNREVQKAVDSLAQLVSADKLSAILYKISEMIKSVKKQTRTNAVGQTRAIINNSDLNEQDIKDAKSGQSEKIAELNVQVGKMVFLANRQSVERFEAAKTSVCKKYSDEVEAGIQATQAEILRMTDSVKAKVANSTAGDILKDFVVPQFPSSLALLKTRLESFTAGVDESTLSQIAADSSDTVYDRKIQTRRRTKYKIEKRQREAQGFWETIKFWNDYYEEVEVPYEESFSEPYQVPRDVYDVEKFKSGVTRELQDRITRAIEEAHNEMEAAIKAEIEAIFSDVQRQCDGVRESYFQLFNDFKNDVDLAQSQTNEHRQALERNIQTISAVKENLQPFFDLWNEILSGAKG